MQHTKMNNPKVSSLVHNSPTSSSPLRKSINSRNVSLMNISENDDEAERISRRRVQATSTSSVASNSGVSNKRHSLSSAFLANIPASKMAECINECIKLSTENKINAKNAFNLELIDFMTYMIKKQDVNMSSLQVASTSLDVSSKIYGFRVDSVHLEILKIVGGLDNQTTDEAEKKSDEDGEAAGEDAENKEEAKKKKKKKHNRQKIISTVEALAGRVEIVKPMSFMIGEGDQQTSDMLSLASLPNHAASGFYVHPYNDVLVDVIENTSESQNDTDMRYNTSAIEDFSNLEICQSYSNFEFLNWSVDNEPEEMDVEEAEDNENDNRFHFDLNASVEHDGNDPAPEPMNYFDIEHDDENKENYVHGCYQEVRNRPNENIRTVRASSNVMSEYSFVQSSLSLHWAGPSHWKFRKFARLSATAGKVTACKQGPLRKRKQIELLYDENNDVIDVKFTPSTTNKISNKTVKGDWTKEAITLPEDVHYDAKVLFKLYIHEKISINTEKADNEKNDAIDLDISDNERYDYNNPNDTMEYCPGVNNGDYDEGGVDDCNLENDATILNTQGFTGDNLVAAPKLANKIPITYCVRAKKIDMRQLKKSIWTCLNSKSDNVDAIREEDNHEATTMKTSKRFSDVYKILPKVLTKSNAEALSAPMAFLSLLHLANEKELSLRSTSDMSDIVITASSEDNTNGET